MHFGEWLRQQRIRKGFVSSKAWVNAFNEWRKARGGAAVAAPTAWQWERWGCLRLEAARDVIEYFGVTEPAEVLALLDTLQRDPRGAVADA